MKQLILCLSYLFTLFAEDFNEAELKHRVITNLQTLEGWCSEEKALSFIDLVLETKPDLCVEIGAFGGSSVYPVAASLQFLNKGHLIAIDPWDKIECIKYFDPIEDAKHLNWWGNLNINYIYYSYLNMLKKYDLEEIVQTLRCTSSQAIFHINDPIDILYIDGNHSEEISISDVRLYLPKVKTGGYIWYNDALWESRQEALDLLLYACDVIELIDGGNCILFKKRSDL